MFCSFCRGCLPVGAKYCPGCGVKLPMIPAAETLPPSTANDESATASKNVPTYETFLKYREENKGNRRAATRHIKKAKLGEVQINIGVMAFNGRKGKLAPVYGQTLGVTVTPLASTEEIIQKATAKHKMFNQYFQDANYKLLYPDGQTIVTLPGSLEIFSLKQYKECLGKNYQRINLFLCADETAGEDDDKEIHFRSVGSKKEDLDETLPLESIHEDELPEISRSIARSTRCINETISRISTSNISVEGMASTSQASSNLAVPDIYEDYAGLIDDSWSSDDETLRRATAASLADQEQPPETKKQNDLEEVLGKFQNEFVEDSKINLLIKRSHLWQSAKREMNKLNFSFSKKPCIEFSGEEAADYGGPTREFFSLLTKYIMRSGVFEGNIFSFNMDLLVEKKYFTIGQIVAWSLCHGGHGLSGLHPQLFDIMTGKNMCSGNVHESCIPDMDIQNKITKLKNATEDEYKTIVESLADWAGEICPTIMMSTHKDKDDIVQRLIMYFLYYRSKPAIDEFVSGVNSVGQLWDVIVDNSDAFKHLFCATPMLTRNKMKSLYRIKWSEDGTNRRGQEGDTIYCWDLYLRDLEVKDKLQDLLMFMTGTNQIPPLGFPKAIVIDFYSYAENERPGFGRLPWVSTCDLSIYLPRGISDSNVFENIFDEAIASAKGFGKV